MAGLNPLMFPEEGLEQTEIARRQKLADSLMAQSMQPMQGQMAGGVYIAPHWSNGLAKLGQALVGNMIQNKADEDTKALANQYQAKLATALQGLAGGGFGQGGPAISPQQIQAMMMLPGGVDKLAGVFADNMKTPEQIKTWGAQGINPQAMAPLTVGAARKGATLELQPGTTAVDLATGGERFQPKLESGQMFQNGQVTTAPNYLSSLGEIEREKAAAGASVKPYKVEPKNGDPYLTNEAAVATGKNPWQVDPAVQAQRDNKAGSLILSEYGDINAAKGALAELNKDLANKNLNASTRQILERQKQFLESGLSEQQTNPPGTIALQSDSKKARDSAALGVQAKNLESIAKDAESMRGMMPVFDQIESLIKSDSGTLGNGIVDRARMIGHKVGIQSNETVNTANLEKLANQLVLARGSLGAGVSVSDAERYDKAAGDLTKAQSNTERLKYLSIMRDVIEQSYSRANSAIKSFNDTGSVPAYQMEKRKRYNPATGRIE